MRILLADNRQTTRFALCTLLEQQPGWHVVGEAKSAEGLLTLIEAYQPGVVLVNWNLPGFTPSVIIPCLQEDYPDVSVIVLSGRPEDRQEALNAGADSFVSKADPPKRLLDAIAGICKTTQ